MVRPVLAMIALSFVIVTGARTHESVARATPVAAQESIHPMSPSIIQCFCTIICTSTGSVFGAGGRGGQACTNATRMCTASGCTTCQQLNFECD